VIAATAAIAGFAHERWGEAPHAFVVLKQGARADVRELREFARANTPCGDAMQASSDSSRERRV